MQRDEIRLAFMCAEIHRREWHIPLGDDEFDRQMFALCNKRADKFLEESKAYKEGLGNE